MIDDNGSELATVKVGETQKRALGRLKLVTGNDGILSNKQGLALMEDEEIVKDGEPYLFQVSVFDANRSGKRQKTFLALLEANDFEAATAGTYRK